MVKRIFIGVLAAAMLATATPVPGTADATASLVVDTASGLTVSGGETKVVAGTSASELLSCFRNRADISLKNAAGEALTFSDTVASGAVLSCGDDSATVIVPGDVNGDGKINARDVIATMRVVLGDTDGTFVSAANVEHDDAVNAADVTKLMKYLVGWDVALGASERPVADKDDPQITMYFDSIMHRIGRSDTTVYGSADGLFYTAKNELEDAQIVLTSEAAKKNLTLQVSAPTNENGKTLGYEVRYGYYYDLSMYESALQGDHTIYISDAFVDPYPPLNGAFDLVKGESKSFMVQVDVPADAESGYYKSDVVLKDSAGNVIKRATLRFCVWDFALDEETACDTLFSTWSGGAAGYYAGVYGNDFPGVDRWPELFAENFYDYMLKNRISGYDLPYDILDKRADAYMSNPRVTSFVSFGGMNSVDWTDEAQRANLRAKYDKLSTDPKWAEKAYIYTVDEPWGIGGSNMVINQWEQAKSVLGDTPFSVVLPFGNGYIDDLGVDQLEYLWNYCNGFCPAEGVLTPSAPSTDRIKNPEMYPRWADYPDERAIRKYGNFQERYNKLRGRGDKMWWYVCCAPEFPYANFFNFYQGAWNRVVLWNQYIINADGLLYWSTNMWQVGERDSRKINLKRTNTGGDGLLVYDAMLWGASEPGTVPSVRFEAVRDGIEDFQYMHQLERTIGREAVLEYVNRIATDVVHHEEDYREMVKVRTEMGFALESLGSEEGEN